MRLGVALAGLALVTTACLSPTHSDCTDAGLLTEAAGSHVDAGGALLATVAMQVSENHPTNPSVIVLALFGPSPQVAGPLRGRVTAVRVVNAAKQVVFAPASLEQIPASENGGALVRSLVLARGDDAASAATRTKLLSNDLTVEIETDYPGAALLRVPLRLVSSERVRLCPE